ncbi:MAG TPA: lysozyme [Sphingomicrobium sp.]|nr:lysozyme [Sphingomicrobium sp.]
MPDRTREAFFEANRLFAPDGRISTDDFRMLDSIARRWRLPERAPPPGPKINAAGLALMRNFEGCKLEAYPDPGSRDGNPWTIGWGATGPGIHKGVRWTQEQADARHEEDVARFAIGVERLLDGAPTNDNQFSALVSLAYNIGLGALAGSTLLKMHKAGDYANAAQQFLRWNRNDGAVMRGLSRRRAAEKALYETAP